MSIAAALVTTLLPPALAMVEEIYKAANTEVERAEIRSALDALSTRLSRIPLPSSVAREEMNRRRRELGGAPTVPAPTEPVEGEDPDGA